MSNMIFFVVFERRDSVKFSAKARYATRMMTRMASDRAGKVWPTQDLAALEKIPVDYVAQIFQFLKRSGLVDSHRGAQGGFSLARDPGAISVAEVIEGADGAISLVPVVEGQDVEPHVMQGVWDGATQVLRNYLGGITIQHLAGQIAQQARNRPITFEI
jgi:Rrf2 family cysteine metabolism transcriptional repressor